jgi:spore germination cell wall hydrolase CwlJ-like protein
VISEGRKDLHWRLLAVALLALVAFASVRNSSSDAEARQLARRSADLQCLAENIYHEARGELLVGQYAVAEVTMNRVRSDDFPDTVCGVVHQTGAFSWTARANLPAPRGDEWQRAQAVALSVYDNDEAPFVGGALYYHTAQVSPDWAPTRTQLARIGHHLFYL